MTCVSLSRVPDALPSPAITRLSTPPPHGLLSAGEERSLAAAIARGDSHARDRLVQANLGLVYKIARDYQGRGLELDDLAGEGTLGLFRVAVEFDPEFGVRFSTYAAYWIKQAIREALTNTTAMIRLPAHIVTLLSKWRKAEGSLTRELGQTPTFDQVAVTLGLSDAQRRMVGQAMRTTRFQQEHEGGDRAGDGSPGPEGHVERSEAAEGLRARMADRLDAREREIVSLRFGLVGGEPLTLKEVGRRLGCTREWVRKVEIRAIAKLRVSEAAWA